MVREVAKVPIPSRLKAGMDARYVRAVFGDPDDIDLHPAARSQLLLVGLKEHDVDDFALHHRSEWDRKVLVSNADLENVKTGFIDGQAVELERRGRRVAKP